MNSRRALSLLAAGLLLVGLAFAQVTATINGSVLDASGAAVPNASISLQLAGSGSNMLTTATSSAGNFSLPSVNAGDYDLVVEAKGFARTVLRSVSVNAGRTQDLPAVKLDVAAAGTTVEVTASADNLQTSTTEVSTTIVNAQINSLPVLDRSPLAFVLTQPGVVQNVRGNSTINGMRPSFVNVTIDGVNIQDNFIRNNDLDYLPNYLSLDQVAEVTVSTSNASSAVGGGAGQVSFITPSGLNTYHGNAYWSNRNKAYAANTWFNNQAGTPLSPLNQNQLGGSMGGRIIRNKLFFYSNYEAYRLNQQTSENKTILSQDARNGIFTYGTAAAPRKVNILQAMGVQPDSIMAAILGQVPSSDKANNFNLGDSSGAFLRNTAGYNLARRNNSTRDNFTLRTDYTPSTKNSFTVTNLWNRAIVDRPDADTTFAVVPTTATNAHRKTLSSSWRWVPTANLINQAQFGFNWAPSAFISSQDIPNFFVTGMTYTNPVNNFRSQGRNTDTTNFADNATWVKGPHTVKFGFQGQRIRIEVYNDAGITPSYALGIGTGGNRGLTATELPGATAADLTSANTLLSTLAGYYQQSAQTFNITDRNSGYVKGATSLRHLQLDNYALYLEDSWKAMRRLTLTGGVRWDYWTPVTERDGLYLLPVLQNNNIIQTLLGNATLDFAGGSTGRDWYKKDKNNFAPHMGLAWDVFGNSNTVFRAGYAISFVNDNLTVATANTATTSIGLSSGVTTAGLSGRVGSGVTPVTTPAYKVPRTFADNVAVSLSNAQAAFDPGLVTPYVQQYSAGIQHRIQNTVLEIRYVGNHATKQLRALDINQVLIGGILPDFLKAQNNGFLKQKAVGGAFDPTFNANIPGSQPVPFFNSLASGGLLTNSTVASLIQTGQVGELANTYTTNGLQGSQNFYRSPYGLGMNLMTNISNSSYNSLQTELTHRFSRGVFVQANYTYGKVLSDAEGNNQSNFEPFLDINNTRLARSRPSDFDVTHSFKANFGYDLPLGQGHRINSGNPILRRVLEGWNLAGINEIQSGSPFSVTSGSRGTLNRGGRSTTNQASTNLDKAALDDLFQFRMTGNGPYFVNASAIGPDGRAVAPDGAAPFAGQVFFNATAGTVGGLQRNYFSGPSIWSLDMKVSKTTRVTERQSVELRMDALNAFNHPVFYVPDQSVNSTTFGKITQTVPALSQTRRLVQLSLTYKF